MSIRRYGFIRLMNKHTKCTVTIVCTHTLPGNLSRFERRHFVNCRIIRCSGCVYFSLQMTNNSWNIPKRCVFHSFDWVFLHLPFVPHFPHLVSPFFGAEFKATRTAWDENNLEFLENLHKCKRPKNMDGIVMGLKKGHNILVLRLELRLPMYVDVARAFFSAWRRSLCKRKMHFDIVCA